MRGLLAVWLCLAWACWGQALSGEAGLYPLEGQLDPWPPRLGRAHLKVKVGAPREGKPSKLKMTVYLDMPKTAMKALETPLVETSPNTFEGDLTFSMRGQWRMQYLLATDQGEFRVISLFDVESKSAPPQVGEICGPELPNMPQVRLTCQPRLGLNQLSLRIVGKEPKELWVAFEMPGMGASLPPQLASRQKDATYRLEADLDMPGVWNVRVDVDGQVPPPLQLEIPEPAPWNVTPWAGLVVFLWALAYRRYPGWSATASLLSLLVGGYLLERRWPVVPTSMTHEAQGLAPIPVKQTRVERIRLAQRVVYSGQVMAEREESTSQPAAPGTRVGSKVMTGPGRWADLRRVRVRAWVPVAERMRLREGLPLTVSDGESLVLGRLESLGQLAQEGKVWLDTHLPNQAPAMPGHDGRPARPAGYTFALGQAVNVTCTLEERSSVLSMPKTALQGDLVYVVIERAGQQLVEARRVRLGLQGDTQVEVLEGLKEGEVVVQEVQQPLWDGAAVTPASWGVGSFRDLLVPEGSEHL